MYLKTLRTAKFRNLKEQAVSFTSGVNFIRGKNGEGKTNLLEAIYVLSLSKSFRTARQSELIAWGEEEAAVHGVVHDVLNDISLAVGIRKGSRQLFVNDARVPSVIEYAGRLVTITFNPSDLALVKGGPALRRSFLDKHITDLRPSLMKHFLSYHKGVAQKSALLQNGTEPESLDSWNFILAQSAHHIISERRNLLRRLEERINEDDSRVGARDGAVGLQLQSNIPDTALEDGWKGIYEFLRSRAGREVQRRKALYGPHRDEVELTLGGTNARAYASQGQTRSFVLSMKLALISLLEEERGDSPVLLLDDVDSELDRERRTALFRAVFERPRQVIITGTEYASAEHQAREGFQLLSLEDGQLT